MILAVRNRRVLVTTLFVVIVIACASVYLMLEAKVILEGIKYFVEDRIGKALDAKVTMDAIQPSIIGPTILKGFSIVKASATDTPFVFKSDKLVIYHNIAQIALERLFKKDNLIQKKLVFKIENGFLYKGDKPIFTNVSGRGKIINNSVVFNDINGKVYDFPISIYGTISGDTSKIDLNIKSASGELRAKMHLANYILKPHVVGTVEYRRGRKFYFSGDFDINPAESVSVDNLMLQNTYLADARLDFMKKRFYAQLKKKTTSADLTPVKDVIEIVADFSKQDIFQASVLFNNFGIGDFDLRSQLDVELAFKAAGQIEGKISTSGTILDDKPFKELEGAFSIQGNVLTVSSLKWGEAYNLYGSVILRSPYDLDLALDIKDGNLSQLFLVSDIDSEGRVSGKVNGRIRTNGPVGNPTTVARLECGKGNLGDLDYESMNVNLRGSGPVLKVADSRILRKEGYIELFGSVDLKRLWSRNPCQGLAWTCGNEAIVWNGWDIAKRLNSQELQMKKGIGRDKEFMVTFKSYLNDEQSWQDAQGPKQNETVGVEYNLDEAKRVKMQLKGNEEVFSLENKMRF